MEAQQSAVEAYAGQIGAEISRSFTEVESSRLNDDRPQLALALPFAERSGAVLVVAKLDRLARNVAFLSRLMESGVDFICCDNPHATRFTIHILAAVAEWEREQISKRTKEALAAAKRRGVLLGSARPGHWDGREEARLRGSLLGVSRSAVVISRAAVAAYADLRPLVLALRSEGLSLAKIATRLNVEGHRTRRGAQFTPVQVERILKQGKVTI